MTMYFYKQIGILLFAILYHTSVVEGGPLLCVSTEPLVKEAYGPDHYNDLGYLKNVIMELARKLHEILSLQTSTRLCHKLEKIRTSWFSVYNLKRSDNENNEKFQQIETVAVSMLDDFIRKVAKVVDKLPIEDQRSLAGAIDEANSRLVASKVYKENEGTLIFEKLDQLKKTFCPDTLFPAFFRRVEENRRLEQNRHNLIDKQPSSNGVSSSAPLSNVYGEPRGAPSSSQAELEKLLAAQHSAHEPVRAAQHPAYEPMRAAQHLEHGPVLASQHSAHGQPVPYHPAGHNQQDHPPLPKSPFIKELPTDGAFEAEVLRQTKPVLVNFHANWCKPCRNFAPRLCNTVIKNGGEVLLVRINVDEKKKISSQFDTRSLPLTIGFKNGREVDKFVGGIADSDVQNFIDKLKSS